MSSIHGDPFAGSLEMALKNFDHLKGEYQKLPDSEVKTRLLNELDAQINEIVVKHKALEQKDRFGKALSQLSLKASKAKGSELVEIQESLRALYIENKEEIPSYLKKETPAASQVEQKPVEIIVADAPSAVSSQDNQSKKLEETDKKVESAAHTTLKSPARTVQKSLFDGPCLLNNTNPAASQVKKPFETKNTINFSGTVDFSQEGFDKRFTSSLTGL